MPVLLSAKQIAELRGCSTQAVYKAPIPRTESKEYDLSDHAVRSWVYGPYVKEVIRESNRIKGADLEDAAEKQLIEEQLRGNIAWKKEQTEIAALKKSVLKKDLVPTSLVAIWIGHFGAHIRTNILTLGNRIARGDTKLRDRIEREVKKALEKTLENAARDLRADGAKIAESLPDE